MDIISKMYINTKSIQLLPLQTILLMHVCINYKYGMENPTKALSPKNMLYACVSDITMSHTNIQQHFQHNSNIKMLILRQAIEMIQKMIYLYVNSLDMTFNAHSPNVQRL